MGRSDDPQEEYIAIATRQFAEHGFHGVSLAALAKEAGVTKQALLHFFGTKERLYGEVLTGLANRLCKEIDAAADNDPVAHLEAYFVGMVASTKTDPNDARLVVRALLDSNARARRWPMKPYLDRLIALTKAMPGHADLPDEAALAWAYQIIGAIQYFAVSSPTVAGIYGTATREALAEHMSAFVAEAVQNFAARGDPFCIGDRART
ncbi:MAG: TetR/AcrR family transcriptional regulator [Paracoccaceae bacterium]|nr:TetR/AcrR family transcriptional regulator [Paracoccaceae bacterium]